MQLYAQDECEKKCYVRSAVKGQDYSCLECGGRVRVRHGQNIRPHFFHIQDAKSCRQAGKTEAHIAIQALICEQVGGESCQEELRFSSINRIADVAWIDKKIVFEVQCSPISAEEVAARNRDYASCGWEVVWVLYDKTFNQKALKPAENELLRSTHYFTDGAMIYDQCHMIKGVRRTRFFSKKPIQLFAIESISFDGAVTVPYFLEVRFCHWRYLVQEDWLHTALKRPDLLPINSRKSVRRIEPLVRFIKSLWNIVLERCCN